METLAVQQTLAPLLAIPAIDRTRRNHGLEHATMTLLAQKYRGAVIVGRSTPNGFYLYGNVSTEAVAGAAHEALRRMKNGEHYLAVHPTCGTNFVVSGIFAALAAFLGFAGANTWRARWGRLPIVSSLITLAFIFSPARPHRRALRRDRRLISISALRCSISCTARTNSPSPNSWMR
ncbi:MAG: uncharacterized protein HW418_2432 [Anaerolineales bacterium]|nr:uncharacterized protein [Anaerolineales bacterium]